MCVAFLGCPPLLGSEGGQQNFMGVLETAMKIANQDADAEDEEEDEQREAAKVINIQSHHQMVKMIVCLLSKTSSVLLFARPASVPTY